MGINITQKIIRSHLTEGRIIPGNQISIRIDQTLWSDLTGIMGGQILEILQPDKVATHPSVIYCDHNTLATSTENADDHLYLKTIAQRFGLYFSKPGNGICHFLHCQRFAKPGQTLLGADSHTPTSGALGMIAIGSGGLTVAKSMLGEGFRLKMPRVLNIKLSGNLQYRVSAKDIALEALRVLTVKGAIGYVIEFSGDGIKNLSIPQRATIANMSIEMGATTGIFPSDQVTRKFLEAQGREEDWCGLMPDDDAEYDQAIEIDLSTLEPLAAKPHMPDQVVKIREIEDIKPGSVFIGSCTNASYSDIAKAAGILNGKNVNKDIDLTIAPGSKQVLEHLIQNGVLAGLVDAGARILECACGPCIGIGQAPPVNGIAVRTSNRNFKGRSGTNHSFVYLVSPETAAATAITGKITDPRDMPDAKKIEDYDEPSEYKINDSMIISPENIKDNKKVEIIRGENIVPLPQRGPLKNEIHATVALKLGDDITTDDIIPGGSNILKYISNIPEFAEYTFHYTDPAFVKRAKTLKHSIIVGGRNYGQGSSREHAALLPMFLGVEAVIAVSYARIHKENLFNYGILPLIFKNSEDYQKLNISDIFIIHDVLKQVEKNEIIIKIKNKNFEFTTVLEASDYDKEVLKQGGAINFLKNKFI